MTINCSGYIVKNDRWAYQADDAAELNSAANKHAERVAWDKLPQAPAYLLVQNAYPCRDCHEAFKAKSMNDHAIIIKVEDNKGSYSSDHFQDASGHPILRGSVPCVIYYFNGQASYVTISDVMAGRSGDPPTGFPLIPDIP
jgi:hypothetical protein